MLAIKKRFLSFSDKNNFFISVSYVLLQELQSNNIKKYSHKYKTILNQNKKFKKNIINIIIKIFIFINKREQIFCLFLFYFIYNYIYF
jgi:hypothetical protein